MTDDYDTQNDTEPNRTTDHNDVVFVVPRHGNGKNNNVHTDKDCTHLQRADHCYEAPRDVIDEDRLCRRCRGVTKSLGPPKGVDPNATRKTLADLDPEDVGLSPVGEREDGDLVTDGGSAVWIVSTAGHTNDRRLHTDRNCPRLQSGNCVYETTRTDHPNKTVCAYCKGAKPSTTGSKTLHDAALNADPDDLITDGGHAESRFADAPDDGDLTRFQWDILYVLAAKRDQTEYGLGLKRSLEAYYGEGVNHGRLYPNLDDLVEHGLIAKSELDKRTNEYALTDAGERLVRQDAAQKQDVVEDIDDGVGGSD